MGDARLRGIHHYRVLARGGDWVFAGSSMSNGQKRELPVLLGQKRMYPENNCGRECLKKNQTTPRPSEHPPVMGEKNCWPYLIGQHPLSPVFGQKRPGTPGNSYFAQLPPVFGYFMFLSGGLLDYLNISTSATRIINSKILPR